MARGSHPAVHRLPLVPPRLSLGGVAPFPYIIKGGPHPQITQLAFALFLPHVWFRNWDVHTGIDTSPDMHPIVLLESVQIFSSSVVLSDRSLGDISRPNTCKTA